MVSQLGYVILFSGTYCVRPYVKNLTITVLLICACFVVSTCWKMERSSSSIDVIRSDEWEDENDVWNSRCSIFTDPIPPRFRDRCPVMRFTAVSIEETIRWAWGKSFITSRLRESRQLCKSGLRVHFQALSLPYNLNWSIQYREMNLFHWSTRKTAASAADVVGFVLLDLIWFHLLWKLIGESLGGWVQHSSTVRFHTAANVESEPFNKI